MPFAGWEMPVQYADGIRAEHLAVRRRRGSSTSRTWARSRSPGPTPRPSCSACTPTTSRGSRSAARSTRCCATSDGGVLDDLFTYRLGARALPDGHERRQPRRRPRLDPLARRRLRRRDHRRARPLRDARRPGPARARDRAGARRPPAARPHDRRARHRRRSRDARSAAPATRARTASSCSWIPRTRPRCGSEICAAAPSPRVWPRATRCAWRPASTSTATTCRSTAARSRRASAGPARRTRTSSAPTPCAPRARPARPRSSCRSSSPAPASRARATPSIGGGEVTSGTMSPCLGIGIGMAYCPDRPRQGRRASSRSTCVASAAQRRGRAQAPLHQGDRWLKPAIPDDLLYHAEHDWARVDGERRDVRHHVVRPGRARRGRLLRPARGRLLGHRR